MAYETSSSYFISHKFCLHHSTHKTPHFFKKKHFSFNSYHKKQYICNRTFLLCKYSNKNKRGKTSQTIKQIVL